MVSMADIQDLGRRIGSAFRPQRVILFGSHAEGRAAADSDVDLLVIMPTHRDPVDESVAIRMAVRPPFPVDVLVRTPEMIERRLERVLPVHPLWEAYRVDLAYLSDFAVAYRYPGESATKQQARDAIQRCRRFRLAAREVLGAG